MRLFCAILVMLALAVVMAITLALCLLPTSLAEVMS